MDKVSKADALPVGGGDPSIRSGPEENKAEEGRISSELEYGSPSALGLPGSQDFRPGLESSPTALGFSSLLATATSSPGFPGM